MQIPPSTLNPKVVILITVPNKQVLRNCTLIFETLKTGFPTFPVIAYDNASDPSLTPIISKKVKDSGAEYKYISHRTHHADWIKRRIAEHDGTLFILDADVMLWKSCEWFEFPQNLAGDYIPGMYNEFTQCESVSRIHTSFMVVQNCQFLQDQIDTFWPLGKDEAVHKDYLPFNPFRPFTIAKDGKPIFYDSCANLYQAIGAAHFEPEHLNCFDHLNSASFFDVMYSRLQNRRAFKQLHDLALTNPQALKGLWKEIKRYYEAHAIY